MNHTVRLFNFVRIPLQDKQHTFVSNSSPNSVNTTLFCYIQEYVHISTITGFKSSKIIERFTIRKSANSCFSLYTLGCFVPFCYFIKGTGDQADCTVFTPLSHVRTSHVRQRIKPTTNLISRIPAKMTKRTKWCQSQRQLLHKSKLNQTDHHAVPFSFTKHA